METAVPNLTAYLDEPLQVGDPDVSGPLAVFPLFGLEARLDYQSFAEGCAHGVTIKEVGDGASVRDLVVTNPTSLPVLLFEGEEVLGAQQNRTFDVSVLVGAQSTLSGQLRRGTPLGRLASRRVVRTGAPDGVSGASSAQERSGAAAGRPRR
jgi:hypothetical protein